MANFFKNNKSTIIASFMTGVILLYFIDPIFSFTANLFITVGSNISKTLVDKIYAQAAHLETQNHAFILYVILQSIMVVFLAIIIVWMLFDIFKKKRAEVEKAEKVEKILENKSVVFVYVFICLILLIMQIFYISVGYAQFRIISTFTRQMRVIEPYINEQEEEEIISQWSLMKNKSDYLKIIKKLNTIAEKNNVELPKNEIYRFFSI